MKKAFRLLAFSFAIVALVAACKNNAPEEETDTTAPVDTPAVVDSLPVDTVAQDTVAAEEPAPAKPAGKKVNNKKPGANETSTTLPGGATATTNNGGKLQRTNNNTPMANQTNTTVNGAPAASAPGKLPRKQ